MAHVTLGTMGIAKPLRFAPDDIRHRMRKARRHRRMTQESLGAAAGMSGDTYRKKEAGDNPFFLEEISRLCDVLQAPSLFPWLDWGEALYVDRTLGKPATPP